MEYKQINYKDFDLAMNIGWYYHSSDYYKAMDMYQLYPDLFVGCYNDYTLIGIAYGWPEYRHRLDRIEMELVIISFIPEYRGKGLGKTLLMEWEKSVKKRGNWLISLGSGADMFYVKMGYTAVDYFFKIHKGQLLNIDTRIINEAWHIKHSEDPMLVLYYKTDGTYNSERIKQIQNKLWADTMGTIFQKQL